ncbi:rhamnogalacturonan acetylesterase [Paenibacillus glacialis]|uniref:rhamnogalacturonan acetylesterase n=1 Tax=Paenibacillus glacialis TaxID=494026 RepID=UPI003CCB8538
MSTILLTTTLLGPVNVKQVDAEASSYKFDFGNESVVPGYIGVSAAEGYTKIKGYGFNTPDKMKNVKSSGIGVNRDAVQFITSGTKSTNTFNIDLPNGLYEVTVTLGDTVKASVAAEEVYQIMNMTGNNPTDKFQIPITDGQLNLLVTAGEAGTAYTLSSLEIKQLSEEPVTNRTVYIGGDSTVCNFYPLMTSERGGWGQMLFRYIKKDTFQLRNMATAGQASRGFRNDGQLEAIANYIKPGDYFILQLGINDTHPKSTITEEEFKFNMRDMIQKVKATGATVILATPQGLASDFNEYGIHSSENKFYRGTILDLAREEGTHLVDLNILSSAYYTSIGPEATSALFLADGLHPTREGAKELARIVVEDLGNQGIDGF